MEAIVLAGGRGSRMSKLTNETQKCLLPIDEQPILGHIMQSLVGAFRSVDLKVGIGYKSQQVIDYVDRNKPSNIDVTFVPHVCGTEGWGIYLDMLQYMSGNFIALPGDIVAMPDVYEMVAEKFDHVVASMAFSPDLLEADTHGVGLIDDEMVVDLHWPRPSDMTNLSCDMTIWASNPSFIDLLRKYSTPKYGIGNSMMKMVKDNLPIAGVCYDLPWVHVAYYQDLNKTMSKGLFQHVDDLVSMGSFVDR